MKPSVAIVGAGAMGAAIGRRLIEHGLTVATPLAGRSAASRQRAAAAGMVDAPEAMLGRHDLVLSILPPSAALATARRLAPLIAAGGRTPVYVDCNAVSPRTAGEIGAAIGAARLPFVDVGIIGGPPAPGTRGPRLYASGEAAARLAVLADYGLDVRLLDAPAGAASALKMAYAGINKGVIGLASAMMLAAVRAGAADALRAELEESQAALLGRLRAGIPDMYGKAHRWAPEMEEIAAFAGDDAATARIFAGMAALYEQLAADHAGPNELTAALSAFLERR